MKNKLIQKAQELRQHGFTTGEIADELNVSMDTARWLTLQKATEEKVESPGDFAINWKSIGGNSTRLSYVSGALSDMALSHGDVDTVVGIAVSGIPFATVMADLMEDMSGEEGEEGSVRRAVIYRAADHESVCLLELRVDFVHYILEDTAVMCGAVTASSASSDVLVSDMDELGLDTLFIERLYHLIKSSRRALISPRAAVYQNYLSH